MVILPCKDNDKILPHHSRKEKNNIGQYNDNRLYVSILTVHL
jgi:hypothetical protein